MEEELEVAAACCLCRAACPRTHRRLRRRCCRWAALSTMTPPRRALTLAKARGFSLTGLRQQRGCPVVFLFLVQEEEEEEEEEEETVASSFPRLDTETPPPVATETVSNACQPCPSTSSGRRCRCKMVQSRTAATHSFIRWLSLDG